MTTATAPIPSGPCMTVLPAGAWWLDLDELVSTFAPVYGDTWDGTTRLLLSDPGDRDIVETLQREMAAGRLREPVRLDVAERLVTNGTHRVVAALTGGVTRLPVTNREPSDQGSDYVEVTFDLTVANPPDGSDWDELGFVCSVLRSFPVGDRWTEALGCGSVHGIFEATYWWSHENIQQLTGAVTARAAAFGGGVTIRSVERLAEDAFDDPQPHRVPDRGC